jgi:predicted SnoaL-like aldol condensation-catalyzing enzyme
MYPEASEATLPRLRHSTSIGSCSRRLRRWSDRTLLGRRDSPTRGRLGWTTLRLGGIQRAHGHEEGSMQAPNQQSETERNKGVVRRFVEEVQNNRDWAVYDELNAPDFVNLSAPPGVPSDREGGKIFLGSFMDAFSDGRWTIDDMIAEGDLVATRKTFTGTHTGDLGQIPATGRSVSLQYVDILRLRDGRIIEHWLSMDQLSFMQQLGVVPTEQTT